MDSQGPTTAVRAGAPTGGVGASRLAQMQMRFQQRQQQERDQRKIEQIATRTSTTTAAAVVTSSNGRTATCSAASAATVELSERLNATTLSSTLGTGKVRQMFDERRHRVAGIDKSYPLQPIQTKTSASGPAAANATTTAAAATAAASTALGATNGNHSVHGNNHTTSGASDGSLARGMAKPGLNNKTRVPPISASARTRLMQQQHQRGQNVSQDSNVGVQSARDNNVGNTLLTEPDAGDYDDNDNFLEQEKFPDTMSLEGDSHGSTNRTHSPNGNYAALKTPSSSTVQKASKKPSVATTTPKSASSTPRSTKGSVKSGTPTSRFVAPVKSNGPLRAVTQPSPASSAGSVRKTSSALASSNGGGMFTAGNSDLANEPVPDGLTRCSNCSRNFANDRIDKHRQICQKTKAKKRKVFDITKHRVQGTDAEKYVLRGKKTSTTGGATHVRKHSSQVPAIAAANSAATAAGGNKQSSWRAKHEEFIATIRAAKELKAHLAKGGKLSDLPPPPPSENPDYIQCPHCSRRFNQTAAERHIPKCATMLHNKPKPRPKAVAPARRY